jgi:anti-sigma B factor antagonist
MDLLLNVRRDDHGATVDVGGEIDHYSGERLLAYAFGVMREHGPRLAVDLADVRFMDCGGVHVLLAIRRRALLLGGQLIVVSASAPVRRVLEIIGMDAVLTSPEPSEVDEWRPSHSTNCEESQRWHCFRPGQAGAHSPPEHSRFVTSRTCTTGWTSC